MSELVISFSPIKKSRDDEATPLPHLAPRAQRNPAPPPPPPKICLYTDSDVFAGTESHILELAIGIRRLGAPVVIAAPQPSVIASRAAELNIPTLDIPKRGFVDFAAIRHLRRLLVDRQLDIIHAHNGRTTLAAAIAVRSAKRGAVVSTQHFLEPNHLRHTGLKRQLTRFAHEWVNRHIHAHIAISCAVRDAMLATGEAVASKISVVLNGISPIDRAALAHPDAVRASLNLSLDTPVLVCMARLEPEKNIASLVTAMKTVVKRHPQAQCLLLGGGSQTDALQSQIKSLHLESNVRLLGFRADALAVLAAADLFVLPSLAEPFGLAIVEAMALRVPVIVTNAGGPKEIVEHEKTGLVVPPDDAPELAAALTRLLADSTLRQHMAAAGYDRFLAHFTADRMAKTILPIYQRMNPDLSDASAEFPVSNA